MNKILKKIILIMVISFSLIEAIYYYNNIIKYEEINITKSDVKNKSLDELHYECKDIYPLEILSAKKEDDIWSLKIKVTGNKEKIEEQILKLDKSTINSYSIWKNGEENNIILEIKGR